MPLPNRVDPFGQLHAVAERGTLMGNRGRIHLPDRTLGARRWATARWIACVLEFRGRHRDVWSPHSYTELFLLDEATALAAGHRPCFECRRDDATRFARAWFAARAEPIPPAPAARIDLALHRDRVDLATGAKRTFTSPAVDLPPGTLFRRSPGAPPELVWNGVARPWSFRGYGHPAPLPPHQVEVLTPSGVVAALRAGYVPRLHPSASA
jgi:hypothetical protein